MRMEVLNVTLIGTLISCFNIRVEQNSKYFLISELITIFPLDVFSFFSNKFTPFCKIFIFMSPSTNISFSNMFEEFRISANNLKSCILRKSINFTYRYGLGFRNQQIHKDDFNFLERIFLVLKQLSTCNTSTFSVSVTSNYAAAFNINLCVKNCSIQFCFADTNNDCFRLFCNEYYFFSFWYKRHAALFYQTHSR